MMAGITIILLLIFLPWGNAAVGAEEVRLSEEATIMLLAARNALKAGYTNKAVQRYRIFVKRYPDVPEGHWELGWLLIQRDAQEEGFTHLKMAGDRNSDDRSSRVQMVEALLLNRRFQQANQELEALLEKFPGDESVQAQLASYYALRRRLPQAQRLFETLAGTSVDKESWMGLVNVALARGDIESASRSLVDLAQRFPDDPYIHKQQVLVWGRQGRISSAYNGLSQIKSRWLRAKTEAELLNVTGQYFSAESRFAEILAGRPHEYGAMLGLAYAYVGQRDDTRAAAAFLSVLDRFPEDLEARLAFVEVLIRQRRWDRGREVIAKVLLEEPDVLEAIYLHHQLNDGFGQSDHGTRATSWPQWWRDSIQSPAEAIRAGQQLARFGDLHGIREVSARFIQERPVPAAVLSQWTGAMIRTGRTQEGLAYLLALRDLQEEGVNLSIAIATLQVHQGQETEARILLEQLPPTFELGALYRKMQQPVNAAEVFSDVVRQDEADTRARIGVIISWAQAGQEEDARKGLSRLFDECPETGWPSLARLLVYAEGPSHSYHMMLHAELKSRGFDDTITSIDIRLSMLALLSQLTYHVEVVEGYRVLNRENPERPQFALGLARAFVQDKESRAIHHIQSVIDAYDRYLTLKPYDVSAWTEKARFLGWQSHYADAEKEYDALLADYPDEKSVLLERDGKQQLWQGHARVASQRYQEILERWPQHEEALSDLGQIHSSRFRFLESQPYYRRLLADNPSHRFASEALGLTKAFARPQVTAGIGYVKMNGFDGALLTEYLPVTAEVFVPFSQNFWAGAGYQWVNFRIPGSPSSANIGRVMARYSSSPFWHVDGFVSNLTYSGTDKSNVNFGAGVSYEWSSGLKGRVETGRQDLWQNAETIRRNLSYHTYAVGAEYQVTRMLELTAGAGYWDYSDNNWNVNGQFSGTYTALPGPHPLRVTYQFDAFGFDERRVYFSPDFFAKHTIALGWQHLLGFPRRKEHHGESPMKNRYSGLNAAQYLGWPIRPVYLPTTPLNTYSLDYGFSVDDESHLYHQFSASLAYAMTMRCHLHATGMLIRADVVDQDSISGFVQCHL